MKVNVLKLTSFRNYQDICIEFEEGINLIYGNNAVGKTNIIEAIDYLSIGRSFRADEDKEMIKFDNEYAKIELNYFREKNNEIKSIISKEGKRFYYNDIELKKLSELSGKIVDVLFTPQDVNIFKDSPNVRRKLLDKTISMMDPMYLKNLAFYRNLLKERNALLKDNQVDEIYLEVLNEKMLDPQFYIFKKRKEILKSLSNSIDKCYQMIDENKNKLTVEYNSFIDEDDEWEYKKKSLARYKELKETDLRRKSTNGGIHHEDFKTLLNGREIDLYGSQGQNRISSLALKIAIFEIIKESISEEPILILDDVLSELDQNKEEKLIKLISNYKQVFITTTERKEIANCHMYHVDNGSIRKEN